MLIAERKLKRLVCCFATEVWVGDAVSLAIRAERCDECRRLEEARGLGVIAGACECRDRQRRPAIVRPIWQQGDRVRDESRLGLVAALTGSVVCAVRSLCGSVLRAERTHPRVRQELRRHEIRHLRWVLGKLYINLGRRRELKS